MTEQPPLEERAATSLKAEDTPSDYTIARINPENAYMGKVVAFALLAGAGYALIRRKHEQVQRSADSLREVVAAFGDGTRAVGDIMKAMMEVYGIIKRR